MTDNDNGAENVNDLTIRDYAAIHLRVPQSGIDWLDDMIRESQRNEFAKAALSECQAIMASEDDYFTSNTPETVARMAWIMADAMLRIGEVKGE